MAMLAIMCCFMLEHHEDSLEGKALLLSIHQLVKVSRTTTSRDPYETGLEQLQRTGPFSFRAKWFKILISYHFALAFRNAQYTNTILTGASREEFVGITTLRYSSQTAADFSRHALEDVSIHPHFSMACSYSNIVLLTLGFCSGQNIFIL